MIIASTAPPRRPRPFSSHGRSATTTPLALPLIVGGGALTVLELLLYLWALIHVRRPARTPSQGAAEDAEAAAAAEVPAAASRLRGPPLRARGRRSVRNRTALGWTGAAVLLGVLLVPVATPAVAAPAKPAGASLTEAQATRIVQAAAAVGSTADKKLDAKALAARFTGAALDLRTAYYAVKAKDKAATSPAVIPTTGAVFKLLEPEASVTWPRTLFATVAQGDSKTIAPIAVALIQNDPRSDYKVAYAMRLTTAPDPAQPPLGPRRRETAGRGHPAARGRTGPARDRVRLRAAEQLEPEREGLPDLGRSAAEGRRAVREEGDRQEARQHRGDHVQGPAGRPERGHRDVDRERRCAVPSARRAVDRQAEAERCHGETTGGTKILSKTSSTSKGIVSVYGYQLLFAVPSAGSNEPIVLLGYDQGLVSAKESDKLAAVPAPPPGGLRGAIDLAPLVARQNQQTAAGRSRVRRAVGGGARQARPVSSSRSATPSSPG